MELVLYSGEISLNRPDEGELLSYRKIQKGNRHTVEVVDGVKCEVMDTGPKNGELKSQIEDQSGSRYTMCSTYQRYEIDNLQRALSVIRNSGGKVS